MLNLEQVRSKSSDAELCAHKDNKSINVAFNKKDHIVDYI